MLKFVHKQNSRCPQLAERFFQRYSTLCGTFSIALTDSLVKLALYASHLALYVGHFSWNQVCPASRRYTVPFMHDLYEDRHSFASFFQYPREIMHPSRLPRYCYAGYGHVMLWTYLSARALTMSLSNVVLPADTNSGHRIVNRAVRHPCLLLTFLQVLCFWLM